MKRELRLLLPCPQDFLIFFLTFVRESTTLNEGARKMADVKQAARWLASGKKVRRSIWSNPEYLLVIDGMEKSSVICVEGNEFEPCAAFNVSDLIATDWEKIS